MLNKRDLRSVLARVRRLRTATRTSNLTNYEILTGYIIETERSLSASKGKPLSPSQEELYNKLEAVVGP